MAVAFAMTYACLDGHMLTFMAVVVPWLVTAAALAAILGALAGLAARVRRRGVGRDLMGPVDSHTLLRHFARA